LQTGLEQVWNWFKVDKPGVDKQVWNWFETGLTKRGQTRFVLQTEPISNGLQTVCKRFATGLQLVCPWDKPGQTGFDPPQPRQAVQT
jgi:hypothetical protein